MPVCATKLIYLNLSELIRQNVQIAETLNFTRESAIFHCEPSGTRTPDNLIKSQVQTLDFTVFVGILVSQKCQCILYTPFQVGFFGHIKMRYFLH